jgi:hypothetical protein
VSAAKTVDVVVMLKKRAINALTNARFRSIKLEYNGDRTVTKDRFRSYDRARRRLSRMNVVELKIPTRRVGYSLSENALSPF